MACMGMSCIPIRKFMVVCSYTYVELSKHFEECIRGKIALLRDCLVELLRKRIHLRSRGAGGANFLWLHLYSTKK
jgi:hypothetical protein